MLKPIDIAFGEYGVKEYPGKQHNPRILKYFHDIGFEWVQEDELASCAAFVNWCLLKAGCVGTGKLNARSFIDLDNNVKVPQFGDIVVFWRISPNSIYGHVAFFVNELNGFYNCLGSNQSDQVKISSYPITKKLAIIRPIYG